MPGGAAGLQNWLLYFVSIDEQGLGSVGCPRWRTEQHKRLAERHIAVRDSLLAESCEFCLFNFRESRKRLGRVAYQLGKSLGLDDSLDAAVRCHAVGIKSNEKSNA